MSDTDETEVMFWAIAEEQGWDLVFRRVFFDNNIRSEVTISVRWRVYRYTWTTIQERFLEPLAMDHTIERVRRELHR